jgi:putative restriction endonuclease
MPSKQSEHVLDGVTYVWTGSRWYNKKTFLNPPSSVLARLNELVEVPHEVVPDLPTPRPVKAGVIGAVAEVTPGMVFPNRKALREAGIHRPLQAGICGTGDTGAESIVLNGGYEDDVDTRAEIIYTGHGGNDPASGQQVADQTLTGTNLSLVRSCEWGLPVRVVRGWREPSGLGPKAGYRYDGLYRVAEYWEARGRSGHKIWRFRLVPYKPEE